MRGRCERGTAGEATGDVKKTPRICDRRSSSSSGQADFCERPAEGGGRGAGGLERDLVVSPPTVGEVGRVGRV